VKYVQSEILERYMNFIGHQAELVTRDSFETVLGSKYETVRMTCDACGWSTRAKPADYRESES
jgi:RNase P subunit RPR2